MSSLGTVSSHPAGPSSTTSSLPTSESVPSQPSSLMASPTQTAAAASASVAAHASTEEGGGDAAADGAMAEHDGRGQASFRQHGRGRGGGGWRGRDTALLNTLTGEEAAASEVAVPDADSGEGACKTQ